MPSVLHPGHPWFPPAHPRYDGFAPLPYRKPPVHDVIRRLAEEGYSIPDPPKPVASYVPCVRAGDLLVLSGQLPFVAGKLLLTGKCPTDVTVQQAQEATVQCLLNGLAVVSGEINGDWDRVQQVVRMGVFVQSRDDFTDQPLVANDASELLVNVFGDAGRHARAAVGVNALPLNACVEAEFTFLLRGDRPNVLASEATAASHESIDIVQAVQTTEVAPPAAL